MWLTYVGSPCLQRNATGRCHNGRGSRAIFSAARVYVAQYINAIARPTQQHASNSITSIGHVAGAGARLRRKATPDRVQHSTEADQLDLFLSWLLANGVEGVGDANSKVALYEGEQDERGVVCVADVAAGELVLRVPLRLAITDHPGDEESNRLLYQDAPWSVRLATKLLRERARGEASPWYRYLQVLPAVVPAPLEAFSWEEMQEVEYNVALAALFHYQWLVQDAYRSCSREALGGASEEEFQWAMSVVHSRTFANAAEGGGVGVRMLVPLVDMLNHGGDESQGPPFASITATDHVRWDLERPAGGSGGWMMAVKAVRPVEAGGQVLLSYGERGNDDFLVHYGFVPPRNAHDDVSIWQSLQEALKWHSDKFGGKLGVDKEAAQQLYAEALALGLQEQQQDPAWKVAPEEAAKVKVLAGCKVRGPVMTAFSHLYGGRVDAAEAAVARRCWQLLGMWVPLLQDLEVLVEDTRQSAAQEDAGGWSDPYWGDMLKHYSVEIQKLHPTAPQQPSPAPTSQDPTAPPSPSSPPSTTIPTNIFASQPAPATPTDSSDLPQASAATTPTNPSTTPPASPGLPQLLQSLFQDPLKMADMTPQMLPSDDPPPTSPSGDTTSPSAEYNVGGQGRRPLQAPLSRALRTAVEFRAHKKMVLWDLLLQLRLPLEKLQ